MPESNSVKPGYRTSEAGMALLFTTLDVLNQFKAESTNTLSSIVLHVLTGLVVMVYIWSRAKVKSSQNGGTVALETIEQLLRTKFGIASKTGPQAEVPIGDATPP